MLRLEGKAVHLWRVALDQASATEKVLSDDERRRAASYRFPQHRREFMAARAALRYLLGIYTGVSPEALQFCYSEYGKPYLNGGLHFSISHARDLALIGISRLQLGVDIERLQTDLAWEDVASHFLPQAEQLWIEDQPRSRRVEAFLRCWTRHEAYGKARSFGLSGAGYGPGATSLPNVSRRVWSTCSLTPCPGYIAAVSCKSPKFALEIFDWQSLSTTTVSNSIEE
jgi:4'-phosphopantetheinyl transferase